jgi:hypothetical protein
VFLHPTHHLIACGRLALAVYEKGWNAMKKIWKREKIKVCFASHAEACEMKLPSGGT